MKGADIISQRAVTVAHDELRPVHEEAMRCIQCGFCLPACPTYKVFGEEKHSPRGRIQLVKSWAEGDTAADAGLLEALDLCLDCRACEIACPIDVRYGAILTGARDALGEGIGRTDAGSTPAADTSAAESASAPAGPDRGPGAPLRDGPIFRWALRQVAARPKRMRLAGRFTAALFRSPVGRPLRRRAENRPDSWFGAAVDFAAALPAPPKVEPFPAKTSKDGDKPASLFLGCAQEGLFPETNRATAALLEAEGFDLDVPRNQVCCGALHRHHGDKLYARELLLRNLHAFGAFDESRDDPVVMNAGGCMAWIQEAAELFEPGTEERRATERLASRVRDVSQMISARSVPETAPGTDPAPTPTAAAPAGPKVVYQPSCHLTNVCGVAEEPLALLNRLTGGRAQLPPDGGSCCGSAGIFNALHPHASKAVLDAKMEGVEDAAPDVIVTSNPGCHLQMLAGVKARGLEGRVRVLQLADFVREYGQL